MEVKLVELTCRACGERYTGEEPQMCCSGRDCGCMGQPSEPILCDECFESILIHRTIL